MKKKRICIINGPNLNMLGVREPDKYGGQSYEQLVAYINGEFDEQDWFELSFFQSNIEGELVGYIQNCRGAADGIVINGGAYSHYSIAVADALLAAGVRAVEVHITNVYNREEARQKSVLAPCCDGQISGLGFTGYSLAVRYLLERCKA